MCSQVHGIFFILNFFIFFKGKIHVAGWRGIYQTRVWSNMTKKTQRDEKKANKYAMIVKLI